MGHQTSDAAPPPFAGVELGGTKCVCTLAYGPDRIVDQCTIHTTGPDETRDAIRAVLRQWHGDHGLRGIGIASFGPVCLDPADPRYGSILATNKPGWRDTDVIGVATEFGVPVGFDTDVNAAALAEIRWGSGRGLRDFAYVTVGTGIGVGLIVHGQPTRGIGHSEIGHIRVPRLPGDHVASACRYHDDCVEGLASGSALVVRLGGRDAAGLSADDPVWDPMIAALAAMCHALVATTGPWRIAIGGGVFERQPHLHARVQAALIASLAGYIDIPTDRPFVTAPALGQLTGPLGSIALAETAWAVADAPDTARTDAPILLHQNG
ncbi:fructokinase [Sphingomonas insulae]|uniref:ROK family protein n=1 Tax=Sphingomonas insulae TaxID=424800 RepID=UPI002011DBAF|nr:ROK family protein [Sphingomonas insulae]NIJ28466.1 fructokinase [Sphingomonas insulae]